MKFEIPFNTDNDLKEKLFLWKFTYVKKIRSTWYNISLSGAVLLLLLLVQKGNFGYVLAMAFFIGVILTSVYFLVQVEKLKRKYVTNSKNRSATLVNTMVVYEFNEDFLEYSDKYLSYKISWAEFANFKSSSTILLMKRKYQDSYTFIISKQDFGEENYFKIGEFLKAKMPQQ